jgi:Arm DNA-binding domain/Phage integrase central domain
VQFGLTVKRIARLKQKGRYSDGGGLYLQVNESGSKSWVFKYERTLRDGNGQPKRKEHMLGLGGLDTFTLAEARERARLLRQQLKNGVDPFSAKRVAKAERELAAAKALTFSQAAQSFYEQHEGQWHNAKHRAQVLSTLTTFAFPIIGNLPVAAVDTGLVLKVLEQRVPAERGYPSALAGAAGDCVTTARPHRGRARLGDRSWLSPRRQSGQMAWTFVGGAPRPQR